MAEAAAGSIAKSLLPLVSTAVVELGKLGWNAEGKLKDLEQFLELIKAFLRDTETTAAVDGGVVGAWLKWLQAVAAEVQQEIAELAKIADQLANRSKKLGGLIPKTMSAIDRVKLGYKVDNINQKLEKIFKMATDLGLQNRVTHVLASSSSVEESAPLFLGDPALVVPRDADVSKVVDMLITSSSTNCAQSLPIISIVGMAGLGKTTLAKMVLKDDRLKSVMERRRQLWVCVSATFDVDGILCQILEDLTREPATSFEKLKRSTIVAKIQEKLEGKSFLLVLDDVWNEDTKKWDELIACLLEARHSDKSIILATTRSQKVVSAMRSPGEFTYPILMLGDDQCWSIIKAKSFGESCVPHNFEVIGKEIGKKCKGVALVASVIGGTMQIDRTEDAWSLIKESNLWNSLESDEEIINVLRLSYDRLGSSSLKMCFEFCSIFSEDSILHKEELIRLWMAAGFLDSSLANDRYSKTAWDIGNKNFGVLVSNSLFQDVESDCYGNIISCKMHDSVRTLARSLSKAMALKSDTNSSIDVSSVPHLNIVGVESEQAQRLIKGNSLQSLFCGIDNFSCVSEKCKGLKILKLVAPGNNCPSSVGDLKDLRYFDVSNTGIEELPKSITNLQKLQTLNVTRCMRLKEFPEHMEKLVELSHLDFGPYPRLMPNNIGSLRSLQTLPYFCVGSEKGRGIEELGRLSHLRGVLKVDKLEYVRCKEKAREAKLNEKKGIYELILRWSWKVEDEGVLEGLEPHLNLKGLKIIDYQGRYLPTWLSSLTTTDNSQIALQNLIKLVLDTCRNCKKLPNLGHLPNLTYLYIWNMHSVKSIDTDFYGGGNFPSLKEFAISDMHSLEEWVETAENNLFPSLENLHLSGCNKLRSCNLLTDGFPSLVKLTIRGCSNLPSISLTKGHPCLKKVDIHGCSQISCVCLEDDGLPSLEELICSYCPKLKKIHLFNKGLPRLQRLIIQHCRELSHIGNGLSSCKCLRKIKIEECDNLELLPSFHELHSLNNLTLRWCKKLLYAPKNLQCCTALQKLKLKYCPKMFPRLEFLDRLESLVELKIWRCGSISWGDGDYSGHRVTHLENAELEAEDLPYFLTYLHPSLQSLTLTFNDWREREHLSPCPRGSEGLFDTIHQCIPSSLQRLTLNGSLYRFSTLPPQIQHMTTLKELKIFELHKIEALPEWLQNLSSLQFLVIHFCPDLTYLPNLSNLNLSLEISKCPKLTSVKFFRGSYTDWISLSATNAPSSS